MDHLSFCLRGLFAFLLVAFIGQAPVHAQQSENPLQRLQEKYQAIEALQAEFSQTMSSPYSDTENKFTGQVVLKDDQYRVETGTQTLVTNGETTWIYSPGENQVLINDYKEDETTFSLNDFLFNYHDRYDVTGTEAVQLDGEKHFRIHMKPKRQSDFFREMTLWMRDRDAMVTRLEVIDRNDTRMTYTLTDIELNPKVSDQTFSFTPPQEAEIVDLRS